MKAIEYIKARFSERSTWMFIFTSIGTAAAIARPFNWIAFAVLVCAAFVPDGPVTQ